MPLWLETTPDADARPRAGRQAPRAAPGIGRTGPGRRCRARLTIRVPSRSKSTAAGAGSRRTRRGAASLGSAPDRRSQWADCSGGMAAKLVTTMRGDTRRRARAGQRSARQANSAACRPLARRREQRAHGHADATPRAARRPSRRAPWRPRSPRGGPASRAARRRAAPVAAVEARIRTSSALPRWRRTLIHDRPADRVDRPARLPATICQPGASDPQRQVGVLAVGAAGSARRSRRPRSRAPAGRPCRR